MRVASLFAGIGGFDLALTRLGHEIVYVNEWDKYAAQTYEKNFRVRPDTRSITDVSTSDIPDHDLLVGGFPCQPFSIAGKRHGFNETRGTLFFDIARILKDKQPRYFILENVKGLLSHDNGSTFKTIIATLTELRYDLEWQVLNSKNFGVPQNRERVFIVGHLRGERRPQIFPFGTGTEAVDKKKNVESVSGTLSTKNQSGQAQWDGSTTLIGTLRTHKDGKGFREVKSGLSPTIPARAREDGSGQPVIYDDMKIRRLTPMECERLQSFPDGWTQGVSDTQRYKQLGNSVTVNVVYEIARRLEDTDDK